MKALDLINKKFNRLTVIERIGLVNKKVQWKCKCECGNIVIVQTCNLTGNKVKSCGCLKNELLIERSTTHNKRHTKLYEVWKSIKQRCYNPNNVAYHNYGARGIIMDKDWKDNFQSFYDWSINHGYKEGLSIDRINNNGSYEPSNCRWADRKTQANNTRTNKYITYNGETHTLAQWSDLLNIKYAVLQKEINLGKTLEEIMSSIK